MDPLSVSSGIVGLLSFTGGLAKLCVEIKQATDQFKSAPSQIGELAEKMEIVETLCNLIEPILRKKQQQQSSLKPNADQTLTAVMSTTLAQCYAKMKALERILATVRLVTRPAAPGKEKGMSKLRTVIKSRIRFVYKIDSIRSAIQQVDEITSLLHFIISLDTWS